MLFSLLEGRNVFLVLIVLSLVFLPVIGFAQEKELNPADTKTGSARTEGIAGDSQVEAPGADASAEEATAASPEYDYTEPAFTETKASYPLMILRTFAVLAVIIVVIWLIFRFLLKSRNKVISDTEIIKILATFPLAANRLIKVVDIAGKILILGVTDANINLITEVEDKELIDRIKLISSQEALGRGSFKEQFFKLIGGRPFTRAGEANYLRGYKDRINRMKRL
jgi:flagellar protein FliO/FliZ